MISGKDVRIENGYIIINGEKNPIVQDTSEIDTEVAALVSKTEFLSFSHFVKVPFNTSALDSIKSAFENGNIPRDLTGITFGVVESPTGGQRVVFIAQNQSVEANQTRYAAIYFGSYIAPHFCQKQDNVPWIDTAL